MKKKRKKLNELSLLQHHKTPGAATTTREQTVLDRGHTLDLDFDLQFPASHSHDLLTNKRSKSVGQIIRVNTDGRRMDKRRLHYLLC